MKDKEGRYEFVLTVKRYGYKTERGYGYGSSIVKDEKNEPIEELKEELEFKSLTAIEVLRKLIDYLS